MTPSGQSVCLCMIVKNETPVIRRCLDSVRPLIDHWLIVDTGSTDGTQAIVREHFRDIPGELIERPWQDFAHNRSEALALARPLADYSLIVDADDAFEVPAGYKLPVLDADSYVVDIRDSSITYQRTQLVRNTLPWRYAGVLHEFLTCEGAKPSGHLPLAMRRNHDGARRRDPDTYKKDAALLERALKTETDPFFVSRYTFYLAQSYRDSREPEKALKHYLARADLGFWDEEVFVALLQAARLKEQLGHPVDEVLAAYERAAASRPTRAEALHGASRLCRYKDRFAEGAALARRGLAIPKPSGALFLEDWIYDYGLDDELAVSAYWSGQYQESLDASLKMLASARCPAEQRKRAEANAEFARRKLKAAAASEPAARSGTHSSRQGEAADAMSTRIERIDPGDAGRIGAATGRRGTLIFAMVSTARSVGYTTLALPSFFRNTPIAVDDEVLLIVNDPGGLPDLDAPGIDRSRLEVIEHSAPLSFAANANLAMRRAQARGAGLVFLNNDIVFTPDWLGPVIADANAITLPTCNQQREYERDGLRLSFTMALADFGGRQAALDAIARDHASLEGGTPWHRDLLMSFFAVHVPLAVFTTVGFFDETFGAGGGEDVDYRIRALLAGFDVRFASKSYVLHFMGRSTWRSGESGTETAARDAAYRHRFTEKWGRVLSSLFLAGGAAARSGAAPAVRDALDRGDYLAAVRASMPAVPPETPPPGTKRRRRTICLSMIVKNEAPVIRRCLDSVRPLVDAWVVVDTGSTDGTQDIVREALAGLPGQLHERPWQDFARNRSEALALARPLADYTLIIDADDSFEAAPNARMPDLDADSYMIDIMDGSIKYQRTQVVSNTLPWRYEGVLHEYIACEDAKTTGHLPLIMRRGHDGARRRDPETYRRDAAVLERALAVETRPHLVARYTFYLAQSYRDCGNHEAALTAYLRRAELGHWDQEVYVSLLSAGRLMQALNRPAEDALAVLRRASTLCPARAEAAYAESHLLRDLKRFREGYEAAKPALQLEPPGDGLFVEPWIYRVGLLDEFAVNAYWAGEHQDSAEACRTLLSRSDLDALQRPRIEANLKFSLDQLKQRQAPATSLAWQPDRPLGGTEIMVEGLRERLPEAFTHIALHINRPDPAAAVGRPIVVWIHHDIDQAAMGWCRDTDLVGRVERFVFVSHWQRERYIQAFGFAPERCIVIRNATSFVSPVRHPGRGSTVSVAYTSTPFRGLSVLLDAWDLLRPARAKLHVWSSMKLYGPARDEGAYRSLLDRAASADGVIYEGLLPNAALKERLRSIDILAYPSTFAETSCLSVIEALAAGCRVVCPTLGALPETCSDFARLYAAPRDPGAHAATFARELEAEFDRPWGSRPHFQWLQQGVCQAFYDWDLRIEEWRALLARLA